MYSRCINAGWVLGNTIDGRRLRCKMDLKAKQLETAASPNEVHYAA